MADIVIDRTDAQIKVGIEKSSDLQSSASEIDRIAYGLNPMVIGNDLYISSTRQELLDITNWINWGTGSGTPVFDNNSNFNKFNFKTFRVGNSSSGVQTQSGKRIGLANTIDLSDAEFFTIWAFVSDHLVEGITALSTSSAFGTLTLAFGDHNLVNSSDTKLFGINGGTWRKGWNNITLNKNDFGVASGTGVDWSAVKDIVLIQKSEAGNVGTILNIDSILAGGKSDIKTPVCITLDDSEVESIEMTSIMNEYGIPVSLFVIDEYVDVNSNYMTLEECKRIYNKGNHLGMHGQLPSEFLLNPTRMKVASDWLKDNGFTRDNGHLYGSYPNGIYKQETIDYAKSIGVKGLRTLKGQVYDASTGQEATTSLIPYEAVLNGGLSDTYRINASKPANLISFQGELDLAISKKAGYLPYHHRFSEFVDKAEWIALAKYLKTKIDDGSIECLTFPQFCRKYDLS